MPLLKNIFLNQPKIILK